MTLRVLQLNFHYSGTGADRCARELFEELPGLGVETEMWVSQRRPHDPPAVKPLQSPWERWMFPLEAFPDLTDWRHRGSITSLRNISDKDFDLVHIHIIHSGWISIRAVRQLTECFPCVWTLHDEWAPKRGLTYDLTGKVMPAEVKRLSRGPIRHIPYHRYHENYKWRRTRRFLRRWMPQPKAVICPSLYMMKLAESADIFPNSEMFHLPYGTRMPDVPEAKMGRAEAKRSFGLSPNHPVALMISADLAQAHKGIDLGIKAIRGVDKTLGLQTLLLGRAAQAIANALPPVPSACTYAPDDATLARAYRAADVTISPSLGENFPYVGLESLACGTPVVCFPIGGTPEMIGNRDRGIVCKAISPTEMAQHLSYLLSEPQVRLAMGDRGVRWVKQTCSMSGYLAETMRIYEHVLSTKATSGVDVASTT